MTPRPDDRPTPVLPAVAGAGTGSLLAAPLVHPPLPVLVLIALLGTVVGAVLALWLGSLATRPPAGAAADRERSAWPPPQPRQAAPPPRSAVSTARPEPAAETVRLVLPVTEEAAPGGWWASQQPARATAGAAAPVARRQAPDLAGYLHAARVVQCPQCGQFRVDVSHVPGGFAFRCRTDDHQWEWRAGTPWPATVSVSRQCRPDPRL